MFSGVEPVDVLALAAENEGLKRRVVHLEGEVRQLKKCIEEKDVSLQEQAEKLAKSKTLSVNIVQQKESKLKNLFTFYTGITFIRFLGLLSFLVPGSNQIDYKSKRTDMKKLSNSDHY